MKPLALQKMTLLERVSSGYTEGLKRHNRGKRKTLSGLSAIAEVKIGGSSRLTLGRNMSFKPRATRRSGLNTSWLLIAVISVATTSALAHHSAQMFDATTTIEVKGTVKEFHWTNPHSWVVIESVDPAGKVSDWSFEANGPGYLVRTGWKRESLKPGDKVTVTANPMRDGSQGGNLVKVATSDGRELAARGGGPPGGTPPGGGPPGGARP